jgi:hypothetical protein
MVQYFDKSRMEINDPKADTSNPFYVTNGLLTVELISGKMQIGNNAFVDREPADIPMASDADDANAPTYRSFGVVSNTWLGNHWADPQVGKFATLTITKDGTVGNDPSKAGVPGVQIAYWDPTTHHNIPKVFGDFLNIVGPIYDGNTKRIVQGRLSEPWFYTTGLPISEAYWAKVKIGGVMKDVLIQVFERRVVTYVPTNPPGFQVEMANIGQHYYQWRYGPGGLPPVAAVPVTEAPATQGSNSKSGTSVPPQQPSIVGQTLNIRGLGEVELSATVKSVQESGAITGVNAKYDARGKYVVLFVSVTNPDGDFTETDPFALRLVDSQGRRYEMVDYQVLQAAHEQYHRDSPWGNGIRTGATVEQVFVFDASPDATGYLLVRQ